MKKKKKKTLHYQVLAGMTDVIRCGFAVLAIILLLLMLGSLLKWLAKDLETMFAELGNNLGEAFLVGR